MQVAINPNIYGPAQLYAKRKGLDITAVIEDFLVKFMSSAKEKEAVADQELPDVVKSLLGAAGGQLADDDLNGRKAYRGYIEEKYR